jgi:hypothetical protein
MKVRNPIISSGLVWESANRTTHKPIFLTTPDFFDVPTNEAILLSQKSAQTFVRYFK